VNQPFINRHEELNFLEKYYKDKDRNLIVIYGRRRVGKTELIKHFIKNKKHVYYLCEKSSLQKNIEKFKEALAECLREEWLRQLEIKDFETLFKTIKKELSEEKIVIVFDEFPHLIEIDRSIPSVFQKIWDEVLKDAYVYLILCGSSIGMMETEVLGYKSPLYGRRTAQWKVSELDIKFVREFLPNYSFEEILYTYAIVGGIPFYFLMLDKRKGVFENIKNLFLWKGGFFYEEAENLLRQEFREPRNYMLILRSISEGKRKIGLISNSSGLDKSAVSRYIEILENLKIVSYELPVTESDKAKRRLYYISDNYFKFWFRFVYPNKSKIEEGLGEVLLEEIKRDFAQYFSEIFETICKKILMSLFQFTKIGRWWHKDKEIDLVGFNNNREILFCECKWKDKVNAEKVLEELKEKAKHVRWNRKKEYFAIFAKSFKKKIKEPNLFLFDLKDMEKILK